MNLGNHLLSLRKSKNLSQEEVADKLNVSRQTISKWETNQSTPDFDKIIPICNLYNITTEELLTENKPTNKENKTIDNEELYDKARKNRAKVISLAILGYIIAIVWISVSIASLGIDAIIATGVFLLIVGLSTIAIIYNSLIMPKRNKTVKEKHQKSLSREINSIIGVVFLIIYLYISFTTMMWHITWIIFVIEALVCSIVRLILNLKAGEYNEK